jgi:hypothetical protein
MAQDKKLSGLMERLSTKSREELLALLEQLMQRQPDIELLAELLIELPLVNTEQKQSRPGRGRERTLDPSTIESQVASAFYNAGEGWEAPMEIAADLGQLYDIGQDFAEAGEWANALAVYATIVEGTIRRYNEIEDESQVSWILAECANGLVECLEIQSTLFPDEQLDIVDREELLAALFNLWKFDYDYGGIEADIARVIVENATEHERKSVEAWLRQEMRPGQDSSSKWQNSKIIPFLTILKQADHFTDEDLLEEYRKAGLYKELAEKMVQFGRQNEALIVAQAELTEPMDVTRFAEQLIQSSESWQEQALGFVETKLDMVEQVLQDKRQDFISARAAETYRRWLEEKYSTSGKPQLALNIAFTRFQTNLDKITYDAVRSAAQLANQPDNAWSDLRPRLIQILEQQNRWGALVNIYLEEGKVKQALAALTEMERVPNTSIQGYGYLSSGFVGNYQANVAKAAEESYPNEAIRLYKSVIQRLIGGRGRENYQQATSFLMRIRPLYQKQGLESEWRVYITDLRNSNKKLRAFKEELDKRAL